MESQGTVNLWLDVCRSEDIIKNIQAMPPSMDVIRAMDDISDTVCSSGL